jgi:endonuclease III
MSHSEERALLAKVAESVYRQHSKELQRMKEQGKKLLRRPDFLWRELVGAFATWGSSSGWDRLSADPENLAQLAYEALAELSPAQRYLQIRKSMRRAGIRWPNRKTRYLDGCFDRIESMGGPENATKLLFEQDGAEAKMRLLMSLPGIGPKYARDIMMNAYHEDFRNTIAVDARISRISECLGLSFSDYAGAERFYQGVAAEAGISGWELDRLMYNYIEEFLEALGCKARRAASEKCREWHAEPSSRE